MTADTTSTVGSSAQGKKQCHFGWWWLATLAAPHLNESLLEVGIPVLRGLAGCILELRACTVAQIGVGHPELIDKGILLPALLLPTLPELTHDLILLPDHLILLPDDLQQGFPQQL
jgi:hypothetical protein